MKKNQIIFMGKKQHARDPRWQFASNLPQAGAQIVDQGHSERPSKLNRHDIFSDYSSFVLRQTFEQETIQLDRAREADAECQRKSRATWIPDAGCEMAEALLLDRRSVSPHNR